MYTSRIKRELLSIIKYKNYYKICYKKHLLYKINMIIVYKYGIKYALFCHFLYYK